MQDTEGNQQFDRQQTADISADFHSLLYKLLESTENVSDPVWVAIPPFSMEELQNEIKALRKGKF